MYPYYNIVVRNKYEVLRTEANEQGEREDIDTNIEKKWQYLKESINHANELAPNRVNKAKQK